MTAPRSDYDNDDETPPSSEGRAGKSKKWSASGKHAPTMKKFHCVVNA